MPLTFNGDAKEVIELGQVWEHALGDKYIIQGTGKMKIGNAGELKQGWTPSVVYCAMTVSKDTTTQQKQPDMQLFTRDEETFRKRFTRVKFFEGKKEKE